MHYRRFIIILVFFIALLVLRSYMWLTIHLTLSKKTRKMYISSLPFIDRWFFWSAPLYIKDKFDKYEKRIIRYTLIVKIYRVLNLYIHVLFVILLLVGILCKLHILPNKTFDYFSFIYIFSIFILLLLVGIIEFSSNKRFHKNRYR